jgi:hypothetical protein
VVRKEVFLVLHMHNILEGCVKCSITKKTDNMLSENFVLLADNMVLSADKIL